MEITKEEEEELLPAPCPAAGCVCASSAGGSALHVLPKEVVEGWGGDTVGPLLPVEAIYCTYPMS